MRNENNIFANIDWITILIYIALVVFGWVSIYGAVYNEFVDKPFWDFSERYGKQLVWISCAIGLAVVMLLLDNKIYDTFSYYIYVAFIALLLITLVFARDIKGSRSWLEIGPLSLQPAEFTKTATCLALAKCMGAFGFNIKDFRMAWKPVLIVLLPMVIIICQKETGSALAYLAFFLVMYRIGMPGLILLFGVCAVVYFIVAIKFGEVPIIPELPDESYGLFVVILIAMFITLCMIWYYLKDFQLIKWSLIASVSLFSITYGLYKFHEIKISFLLVAYVCVAFIILGCLFMLVKQRRLPYLLIPLFLSGSIAFGNMSDFAFNTILQEHQKVRIKVTLGMINDPKKSGYNVNQSVIAIGSGQLTGKGFLQGTQTKLRYVPEQDTDFIFCTVGEEHGFVGTATVIILFLVLMLRLLYLAERQRSSFGMIYGYCVASIFFFHLAINVGMVTGLTPVIGIPLPFFSYGGSSLWSFTILLFIFLRLDASRDEYMG